MARRRKPAATFSLFAFQDIITAVMGIMVLVTIMLALQLIQRSQDSPPVQTNQIVEDLEKSIASLQTQIKQAELVKQASDSQVDAIAIDEETATRNLAKLLDANDRSQEELKQLRDKRSRAIKRQEEAQTKDLASATEKEQLKTLIQETDSTKQEIEKLTSSDRVIYKSLALPGKTVWLTQIDADEIQVAQIGQKMKPLIFTNSADYLDWARSLSKSSNAFFLVTKPAGVENLNAVEDEFNQKDMMAGYDLINQDQMILDPLTGAAN